MTEDHNSQVEGQFSANAVAYLESQVHAAGPDLLQIPGIIGQHPDRVALDIGCGAGHLSFALSPCVGKVIACDLTPAMLNQVSKGAQERGLGNIETQQADVEALPFPPDSFDVIATRYSAHHWKNMTLGLRQIRNCTRRGAPALFMDVCTPSAPLLNTWLQSLELLRDGSHVANANLAQWLTRLSSADFTVQSVQTFRLPLDFASWVKRSNTPPNLVTALQDLRQNAPREVVDYFEIKPDGSFTVDSVLIVARAS